MDLTKLLGKKVDIGKVVAAAMEHVDMEGIVAEVMSNLRLEDVELYFVYTDEYDFIFVGMAYSEKAARELKDKHDKKRFAEAKILRLDIEKLLQLAMEIRVTEEIV